MRYFREEPGNVYITLTRSSKVEDKDINVRTMATRLFVIMQEKPCIRILVDFDE